MLIGRTSLTLLATVCSTSPGWAADDALLAAQRQAAQVVTVARTAPLLCPWIEADDEAIRALMEHTQITDRDIMDPERFGADDEDVARSFAQSVREDPAYCAKVFGYLGDGGVKLLQRRTGAPG